MKKMILAMSLCSFLAGVGIAALSEAEFARGVIVYRYRPQVFADQKIQIGLPGNSQALSDMLWYIRMDESARALFGMENLSALVQQDQIPGLDFSGHKTLIDSDLERLFGQDLWRSHAAGYKFRLLKLVGTAISDRALMTIGKLMDLDVLELGDRVTDERRPARDQLVQDRSERPQVGAAIDVAR